MADTELVSARNKGDDEEFEPKERYSSNNVIAAQEITFTAKKKAEAIKNKQKQGKISKKEAKTELKAAYKTLTHTLDKIALEKELETNLENGLSSGEYQALLERYGENKLTPPKQHPWWWRLIKAIFGGFFNILLWVGGILCFISYGLDSKDQTNFWLGVVLCSVVTLNGVFGYYQEGKSADLMKSLSDLNKASDVTVIRDGKTSVVPPTTLVPGEIIELVSGQAVPADVRVFWCSPDMEVNNASLTGEADPLTRDWRPEPDEIAPAESKNLMFFGTSVVNGKGKCVVYATGDNTFMGRTAQLASSTEGEDTPIAKEIKDFVFKVSIIAFALGISFFIMGMVDNGVIVRNVVFLIGIIVANVPEGLLATVTVSLTLTAKKMYTKNVRVKNLESVETLGSTSVICSDKTGTLTTSVMTCQHVYYDLEERLADTSNPYQSLAGDFYNKDKSRKPDFLRLIRCAALCNNADFVDNPKAENNGQVRQGANPTEAAMVKFSSGHIAAEYQINVPKYRKVHEKLHEIPFNSKNKWQVSVHEVTNDYLIGDEKSDSKNDDKDEKKSDQPKKRALVQMKGAPERILGLCDRYFIDGETQELNESSREKIMKGVLALGGKGERVLALAELQLDPDEFDLNVLEPVPKSDYGEEIDNTLKDKKCVVVVWEENERIEVDLSKAKNEDGEDVPFDDLIVRYVGKALVSKVKLKYNSIRLYYGNKGRLAGDETFKVLKISPGSVFYGYKGPFKFQGTNTENINFPFNRSNEQGLNFLGLYAMIDPPRPGVPQAVLKCQSAGIRVIMVTGDHPVTAKAIAQQVNIIGDGAKTIEDVAAEKYGGNIAQVKEDEYNAVVVPGWELQKVLDTESEDPQGVATFWNVTLKQPNVVFARTSPQQKLLIVAAVQERGGIVAVTGDGVNDSPALKKADIGVAMGITGTDVAKEAADMILLDDNFASIVNGVEEGRIIFDNLKKSIAYTLSSNIPEIAPFLLFQLMGIPLPLTTPMILLVDLGTDLAPAISMAYEGKEADIMKRPPRNPLIHKLVTWKLISFSYLQIGMLQAIAGFYAYFVVLNGYGIPYNYTPRMDTFRAYGFSTNDNVNRDAYWMWCFTDSTKCLYSPEFSFSWLKPTRKLGQVLCNPNTNNGTNLPPCYYYQELFALYQRSAETKPQFRTEFKNYLVDTCKKLSTCNNAAVTTNLLNGQIENGNYLIWNYENFTEATVKSCLASGTSESRNPPGACQVILGPNVPGVPTPVTTVLEFQPIWETSIEPSYRSKLLTNDLFPNRFCYEDYSNLYTVSQKKKFTIQCNERDHPAKPRTFIHFPTSPTEDIEPDPNFDPKHSRKYSLFPMSMTTRTKALSAANTAYFISIVVVQWADLMICKTRIRSLFEQGMTNTFMNFALLCETLLGASICYLPLEVVLGTSGLRFVWWTSAIPFSLMIYIYDEVRKGYIRKNKGSWIHRNTYW